jgi:flagellar basal body P-ring formation protein FlgA
MHRLFAQLLLFTFVCPVFGAETWYAQAMGVTRGILENEIQQIAEQLKLDDYEAVIDITQPDERLNFRPCAQTPLVELPSPLNLGRLHIKVSCPQQPWAIMLPVNLDIIAPVVITSRALPRENIFKDSDLDYQSLPLGTLSQGYFLHIKDLHGQQVKRPLAARTQLTRHHVIPAIMVRRGDAVAITVEKGSLSVRMMGEALSDGRAGEQIRVINNQSQRTITARVVEPGIVKVD